MPAASTPPHRDPTTGTRAHGRWFPDPYLWLQDLDSSAARAFVTAEARATRELLDLVPGRDAWRARLERANAFARRTTVHVTAEGTVFEWWQPAGAPKAVLTTRSAHDPTRRTVLDTLAWPTEDVAVFAVPSPDGTLLAVGRSSGSSHDARVQVVDLATGATVSDGLRGVRPTTPVWHPDGGGLYYAAVPDPRDADASRSEVVYRHRLGAAGSEQVVVGPAAADGTGRDDLWCAVRRSADGRFLVVTQWDFVDANQVVLVDLDSGALRPVATGWRALHQVDVVADTVLVVTDDDAPRGRCVRAPLDAPQRWSTLVAEHPTDTLQTLTPVAGRLYAVWSHDAASRVEVFGLDGTSHGPLALPGVGAVDHNAGEGIVSGVSGSWSGVDVDVAFESFAQPRSVYRLGRRDDRLRPVDTPDVGLAPTDVVTELVRFPSADGVEVSMYVVSLRDTPRDGARPTRLHGYGGFNIAVEPRFTAPNVAWLQAGGVLAFAHVRGGGEYGREWHLAAVRTHRHRAFDDFAAAARWLAGSGWTRRDKIVARGNSNGGLLVAASALRHPDAFGAVFCRAAVLDMLRFPLFPNLVSTVNEYGSPDDPVEGPYLASYSPYHRIDPAADLPPMAFVAALNDRIAPPHDPVKMVARLRHDAPDGGPYLLVPLDSSGHAGGTTSVAVAAQDLDELVFCDWATRDGRTTGRLDAAGGPDRGRVATAD